MNLTLLAATYANAFEFQYRRTNVNGGKDSVLPWIDIPQHVIAASLASTVFSISAPVATAVFIGLPLTCKTVRYFTKENTKMHKIADSGDHIMRLVSKTTTLVACIHAIPAAPDTFLKIFAGLRFSILFAVALKDIKTTKDYASSQTTFESAIKKNYKSFTW